MPPRAALPLYLAGSWYRFFHSTKRHTAAPAKVFTTMFGEAAHFDGVASELFTTSLVPVAESPRRNAGEIAARRLRLSLV